ncbi:MAG: hypothetical protein Alpg2KO_02110 [Alphaproteobacteria bacterium]
MTSPTLTALIARGSAARRGVSLASYGLIVGLISIVALAAVTTTGSSVNSVFTDASDSLQGVTGGSTDAAVADPSPVTPCDGLNQIASAPRAGGGSYALCSFGRNIPSDLAQAQSLSAGCINPTDITGDFFTGEGFYAGNQIGAIRYEFGTIQPVGVTSGSNSGGSYGCDNAACDSSSFISNLNFDSSTDAVINPSLCHVSFDGQDMSGQTSYFLSVSKMQLNNRNMGGIQSSTRPPDAGLVSAIWLRRYQQTGDLFFGNARSTGVILQEIP